jgi:hypothetical protein
MHLLKFLQNFPTKVKYRLGWKPYPSPESPVCNLCGSTKKQPVATRVEFGMKYQTVLCLDCSLVYLCPRPTEKHFLKFYRTLYPKLYGAEHISLVTTPRGEKVVDFIETQVDISQLRGIFDIGCGNTGLIRAFADHLNTQTIPPCKLSGCDPGLPECNASGNLVIKQGHLEISLNNRPIEEQYGLLGQYQLFALYDVIEHLLSPYVFCQSLYTHTPDDAYLFISTNCLNHWKDIPPHGWDNYYLRLAHTYTFTKYTLQALLQKSGWHPIAWSPAPKGDQWLLCNKVPTELDKPETTQHVLSFIDLYKKRCQSY